MSVFTITDEGLHGQVHCVIANTYAEAEKIWERKHGFKPKKIEIYSDYVLVAKKVVSKQIKIKIFYDSNVGALENEINDWLGKYPEVKIISTTQSVNLSSTDDELLMATTIFYEEVSK